MTTETKRDIITEGQRDYQELVDKITSDPVRRARYEELSAKKELWLQLVEARQAAGLTQGQLAKRLGVHQSQVARVEKRGYEQYTLTTLRRYVQALGEGFSIDVKIRAPKTAHRSELATVSP